MPTMQEREFLHHQECNISMCRLMAARKQLWHSGGLDEFGRTVFGAAREVLPDWPGFRRLNLTADDRGALQCCEEETNDSVEDMRQRAAIFALTDQGGGVFTFVAHPKPPPREE